MLCFLLLLDLLLIVLFNVLLASEKLVIFILSLQLRTAQFLPEFSDFVLLLIRAHFVVDAVMRIVGRSILVLECVPLVFEFFHLGFFGEDFLGELRDAAELTLDSGVLVVTVLDVVDDEGAVAASREQVVVIE